MLSGRMLSHRDAETVKKWLRQVAALEDRLTSGLLSIQHEGADQKVRLSYRVNPDISIHMGGNTLTLGARTRMFVIVSEFSFGVDELLFYQPDEEVFVNNIPVGWELYRHDPHGPGTVEFTFPSFLSAVTYADLTVSQ